MSVSDLALVQRPDLEHPDRALRLSDFYRPWPKQKQFHELGVKHRLQVGGFGSAKSRALLMEAVRQCLQFPGVNCIILRKTIPDLKRTVIDKFEADVPKEVYERGSQEKGTFNKSDHIVYFIPRLADDYFVDAETGELRYIIDPSTGKRKQALKQSKLYFAACERVQDVGKYLSTEFVFVGFEELGEFPYLIYDAMEGRNRCTVPGTRACMASATNPMGIGWCVPHGEVLTPHGWKDIREFQAGDPVFTVDSSMNLLATTVAQVHRQRYQGFLAETNMRGLHISCTLDHAVMRRMETKTKTGRVYLGTRLTPWNELPEECRLVRSVSWKGTPIGTFCVPQIPTKRKPRLQQPMSLSGKQFCSLLGWYLSEGSIQDAYHFSISQSSKHEEERKKIEEALVGFSTQRWSGRNLSICAQHWARYFKQFGKSRDKFIPDFVKNSSREELEALFEALVLGDGHTVSASSGQYYTVSQRLADDVCEVAVKLGYIVHVSGRMRMSNPRYPEGTIAYCINFKKTKDGSTMIRRSGPAKSDTQYVPFDGEVYCLGIDKTHSFVIRQKGSVWISGNSWIKKLWIDKKPVREMDADKYDKNDYAFVHSTVDDNPILSKDKAYIASLEKSPLRQKIRWGDIETVSGQYFENFDEDRHVRPFEDFLFEAWQPVWVGWDYGFGHFAVINFMTKAILKELPPERLKQVSLGEALLRSRPRQVNVTILELILHEQTPKEQTVALVSSIPRMKDEDGYDTGYAWDIDSIHFSWERFNRTVENRTVADEVGDYLVAADLPRPSRSNTDRIAGWTKMYEMLDTDEWFFLKGACPTLVEAITGLTRGDGTVVSAEDVVKPKGISLTDDCGDSMRYAVAGFLLEPGQKPRQQLLREKLAGIKDPMARQVVMYKEHIARLKEDRGDNQSGSGKIIPTWMRRAGVKPQ